MGKRDTRWLLRRGKTYSAIRAVRDLYERRSSPARSPAGWSSPCTQPTSALPSPGAMRPWPRWLEK